MESKHFSVVILLLFGLCHGVSEASECTARGRYPNNEVADCRGYTICLAGGITNFTQYKLPCPKGFVYSHFDEQCTNSTNYKCYPSFNCTSVGNFAVPETTDCSSYVACVETLSGLSTARLVGCPQNMLFNSGANVCVNSTEFTCTTQKTIVENVANHMDEASNNAVFTKISLSMLFSIVLLRFTFLY